MASESAVGRAEPGDPDGFRFRHEVDVRFRDLDPGGHAHYSTVLVYFEEARNAYWREVVGRRSIEEIDYVVSEARVRFRRRIRYPQRVVVAVRAARVERVRFSLEYELRTGGGELLCEGRTVQVMFDYEAERPMRLPQEVRRRVRGFEDGTAAD